ncbi:hypothetical protein WH390_01110 [Candidatus Arsenophonus nilaparvatae]|uniref:hypothetical protein n=2 Tax=Candidatus Arsenophonus nilaparvatae TaxID=1247023 RepID=UPI0038783895
MAGINVVENLAINELYEKYLKLPEIQQQLQHPETKYTFGDSEGNANWADKHAMNYLLLSSKKPGRVIGREIFKRETCDKCGSTWDKLDLSGTSQGD